MFAKCWISCLTSLVLLLTAGCLLRSWWSRSSNVVKTRLLFRCGGLMEVLLQTICKMRCWELYLCECLRNRRNPCWLFAQHCFAWLYRGWTVSMMFNTLSKETEIMQFDLPWCPDQTHGGMRIYTVRYWSDLTINFCELYLAVSMSSLHFSAWLKPITLMSNLIKCKLVACTEGSDINKIKCLKQPVTYSYKCFSISYQKRTYLCSTNLWQDVGLK